MGIVTHLLDTHTVIWAYEDAEVLGARARSVIQQARPRSLAISDFTLLEIATLVGKERLKLDLPLRTFLERIEADYVVLPLGAHAAANAMDLRLEQADPFDRAIVATAQAHAIPLLTRDGQITRSGLIPVIW